MTEIGRKCPITEALQGLVSDDLIFGWSCRINDWDGKRVWTVSYVGGGADEKTTDEVLDYITVHWANAA